MKYFNFLVVIALPWLITSESEVNALEAFRTTTQLTVINNSVLVAEAGVSSQFVTAEKDHPTEGTLKIIKEDGKQYIEFGDDFKTVEGPDIEIILHKNNTVPVNIEEEDYITIAPIQNLEGAQRYEVPEEIDLSDYSSIAVWCQQFNVTFGYAPL